MLSRAVAFLWQGTFATLERFPLAAFLSLLFCILSIYGTHYSGITNSLQTLFCGFFGCLALQLLAESRFWKTSSYYLVACVFLAAIGSHFHTHVGSTSFAFMGGGLFLSIFIAPFLGRNTTGQQIWACRRRWKNV